VEIEKDCCFTLSKNFDHEIICNDINKVTLGHTDILIGGSPCQSLSNANRNTHTGILEDPKNNLIISYIEKVKEVSPLVFVFENVPQVVTALDGQFVKEFKEQLPDYHIEVKILNAVDYGTAQARKRAFFIGSRIGIINHPNPINKINTVKDVFINLNENIPNQLDISKNSEQTLERISYIKEGNNWKDIPEHLRGKWTHSSMYRRLELDKPSVTITNFRKTMLLHPTENRIISVREGARIQGFNDDYIFYGTMANKQQMVANAVPIPLARAIAESIHKQIINLTYKINKPVIAARQ